MRDEETLFKSWCGITSERLLFNRWGHLTDATCKRCLAVCLNSVWVYTGNSRVKQ